MSRYYVAHLLIASVISFISFVTVPVEYTHAVGFAFVIGMLVRDEEKETSIDYVNILLYLVASFAMVVLMLLTSATPALAGALFYAGREVRDFQRNGWWDWKGLLWPVVPLTAAEIALRIFT